MAPPAPRTPDPARLPQLTGPPQLTGRLHQRRPARTLRRWLTAPAIVVSAAAAGLLAVPLPSAGAAPVTTTAHTAPAAKQANQAKTAKQALVSDPASLVNPFIGTTNAADDFPGADVPFGMVQWSPDTPSRPDGGGYEYNDSSITGFSLTHIAGPGCGAEGDIPVLPTVGAVSGSATDSFSHSNESANAGDYKVALANGVTTELTATTRTGMADFTFPASSAANLIFKLDDSQNGDSATSWGVVSSTEVQGSATSGNFCGAGNTYTVYFDMQFSQPFSSSGTLTSTNAQAGIRQVSGSATEKPNQPVFHGTRNKGIAQSSAGNAAKAAQSKPALTGPAGSYLTFNTTGNQTVLAKVGVSYVSKANAKANLTTENSGFNFATTQTAAHSAWNSVLGKIGVAGGTSAQQAQFYTALYHSLLHPNVFSDDNGQYQGVDGKVHTVDSGHSAFYTNFSGWDIYRTQAQLEALVDPAAASDTAQSMVDDYAQDGMFPKWMEDNGESYVMVGDPSDPILADYYAFGGTNFSTSTALSDMVNEATTTNNVRPGNNYLSTPGYLPHDGSYGCCNFYGPASTTLEYDTADFAISSFAGALGNSGDQQTFANRAQDWRNVLNPDSGFAQPRNADGTWTSDFDPTSGTDFVEADSWIYTGMVPFDVAGLAQAKGGNAAMAAYLGTVLRNFTGANGYAWVGNEPSIELPWEYDYIGQPYQTQGTVRQIQDQIWSDTPGGLADGNDDLGAMSAWYVWAALGMYPMTPGSSALALGSPMFTQAQLALPSGNTLTINGNGAADNAPYVQSATWNGSSWGNAYAPTAALTSGGTLSYTLGTAANQSWASASSAAPPSYAGNVAAPPSPRTGPIVSGVSSSLCLDDSQSSTTDGNPIQLYTCNNTDAQSWTVAPDSTVRTLGKCLDAVQSGTSNGTKIDLYHCNGSGAQQWTAGSNGSLINPESNLCLDDPSGSTSTGTQLQLYTCNGSGAQNWTLPAVTAVTGAVTAGVGSNLCLDDRSATAANGNPVQIYTCNSTSAQNWTEQSDGTIRVLGSCMDVTGGGTTNGTLIDLYSCTGSGNQQWKATSSGQLINPQSGLCLDDPSSSTTSGTQLQLYGCDSTSAQVWHLP